MSKQKNLIEASQNVTFDTDGKVGIGTSSPSDKLHVSNSYTAPTGGHDGSVHTIISNSGSANNYVGMELSGGNNGGSFIHFGDTDDANVGAVSYFHNGNYMRFDTNASEAMRIDSSGNLLVGKTTADGSVSEGFEARADGFFYAIANSSGSVIGRDGNTGTALFFRHNNATVGSVSITASSTSFNVSSDHRLKENVVNLTGATARLNQLAPRRFNFIVDDTTTVDGFIAHEVQSVVPEAIHGTHNEVETWTQDEIDAGDAPANTSAGDSKLDDDGNTIPVYQGIDQSKLVPLLTAALQEALTEITDLKARVAALEAV